MSRPAALVLLVGLVLCILLISIAPPGFARTLSAYVLGCANWMIADLFEERAKRRASEGHR